MEFNLSHYNLLLPLKHKWETYKINKTASININDRKLISQVIRETTGVIANWCCTESVAVNFRQAMNAFDKFEKANIANPVKVTIEQKTYYR